MEMKESLSKKILISLSCALFLVIGYIQFIGIEVGRAHVSIDESEHRLYSPYSPTSKIYWTFTREYSYPCSLKGHSAAIDYYEPYLFIWEYKMGVGRWKKQPAAIDSKATP